jgi:hypothetical protein
MKELGPPYGHRNAEATGGTYSTSSARSINDHRIFRLSALAVLRFDQQLELGRLGAFCWTYPPR